MSSHEYNTRTKKALANLGQNTTNSINWIEFKEEINNLKDVIIKRLQDQNVILRDKWSTLEQKLVEFECGAFNNLEQYGRRNNIIISDIPDSVVCNQLEESVTKILTDINVNVASNDIEACHRIRKKDSRIGSTKTIIRLVNRKHGKQALYNKKNFPKSKKKYTFNPNNNLFFISEKLTRMNESLAFQGRKLMRNNLVNACYVRDGIITLTINERSKAIKIHRIKDLLEFFPNIDFEDKPFHVASPDVLGQSMYWVGFSSLRICVSSLVIRIDGFCSSTWLIYI